MAESSIDDILASWAESESDESEGSETGEAAGAETKSAGPHNKTIKQIRDHGKALERELTKLRKENEELAAFRSTVVKEQTTSKVKEAFKTVYGDEAEAEKYSKLFFRGRAEDQEVKAEELQEFLSDFAPQGSAPEAPAREGGSFPVTPGGSPTVPTPMSGADAVEALRRGDFDAVADAVEKGRLARPEVPWRTKDQN